MPDIMPEFWNEGRQESLLEVYFLDFFQASFALVIEF